MRRVLEITFSGDEYHPIIASNADEAVSALRNDAPHIALIDAHLGAENGYDLCRQVKSALPHVKVLLLTSKQRPYDADQGTAAGADDYFDKPFDSQKLLDKVAALASVLEAAPAESPQPEPAQPEPPQPLSPLSEAPVLNAPLSEPAFASPTEPLMATPASTPALLETPAAVSSEPVEELFLDEEEASEVHAVEPVEVVAQDSALPALADLETKLQGLGLDAAQLAGVLSLSKAVVEQVVWEVVPQLAETMIKEEIKRLTND
jgi:CheY-like chemotaxis protein